MSPCAIEVSPLGEFMSVALMNSPSNAMFESHMCSAMSGLPPGSLNAALSAESSSAGTMRRYSQVSSRHRYLKLATAPATAFAISGSSGLA